MAKASFCFLLLLGYIWLSEFLASSQDVPGKDVPGKDIHDAEVRLKSDLMKNYQLDVLPIHNSSSPVVVKFAIQIILIKDLDAKSQTLTTESWLKMTWDDSRLVWDPTDYAGLSVIRFVPHKVWQPDIKLYNSAKMSEMEVKTDVLMLVYPNGQVLWIPPVSLATLCEVDLKYYPYDKHTCIYKFGSWTHGGDHVQMEVYGDGKMDSMDLTDTWKQGGEWEIVDTSVTKNSVVYACCEEAYFDVTHTVTLQRRSPFYKVSILCPLIAATILTLASFWVTATSYHRISLNVVSFFTMIAILMHLSIKLPAVGNNCPLIMIFCGILLLISAFATLISIVFVLIIRSKYSEQTPEWVRQIAQSRIMKICCISTTTTQNSIQANEMDYSANLVSEENMKTPRSQATSKPNSWIMFFQLVDRLLFIFCLIVIFAVMIATSA